MLRLSFVINSLRKGPVGQALDPTVSGVGGAYIKDIVCGATDGIVTTFAVVAAGAGAHLSLGVIILLGLAALVADGFSMAAGAYLGTKSEREFVENERVRAIDTIVEAPEEAKGQTVEILEKKGVPSTVGQRFVRLISRNRRLWRDFMVSQQHGLTPPESSSPITNGLATYLAFVAAGLVPLVFVLLPAEPTYGATFLLSAVATAIALFALGVVRARVTQGRELHSGLEVLFIGGIAAGLAFGVGYLLQGYGAV